MSVPYADNIVFNLTLYNNESYPIPAELYISRDQAFINKLENYYIRLIGADISTANIPLFIYGNDMSVRIVNDGIASEVPVTFSVPFSTTPNNIYFLQQFINGVNSALRTAHVNSGSPGNAPLFIYENGEMRFIVDQLYNPNLISIGFNDILINKFPSFDLNYSVTDDTFYILYGQFGNNLYNTLPGGINYPVYSIRANSSGYNALQEFNNIIVTCNSIPVNKQQINNISIATITLGVLDIIPVPFEAVTSITTINHTQSIASYNDILSRGALSEIDFKLYVIDQNYKLLPLTIIPKTSVTCRIEFINKELVKNYYPTSSAVGINQII